MALDKITTDGETNSAWRTAINGGLSLLNSDILQADTTIAVTQSGNQSTTQCVVTGHTSATFNASDYSNDAAQTIQTAIDSIPKNQSGHQLTIVFGDTTGQTIEISSRINFIGFNGDTIVIKSAKESDNTDDSATKANKIQSEGTSLDRIFGIYYNSSEVNIAGLELIQTTSTQSPQFVVGTNQSWVDIGHCKLVISGTSSGRYGVLSQRGSNTYVRDCWFDGGYSAVLAQNSGQISAQNIQNTGTQPVYGAYASNGIILIGGNQIEGTTATYFASSGGLITHKSGVILEETILQSTKIVNLDNSMSVTEIQNIINDQPRHLNGHTLKFRFADGEYDFLSGGITFDGFDGGYLTVEGNTSDTLAADGTGLSVKLKGDQGSNSGLAIFLNCSARCHIKYIAFEQDSTSVTDQRLLRLYSTAHGLVEHCSFNSLSTGRANEGIVALDGRCRIGNCKFNNLGRAIYSIQNSTHSHNNAEFSGGTAPNNGLVSIEGSIITQQDTQINGHTNDTVKASGGVIFNSNGTLA